MIKTKKQMYLVIGAFALVILLGGVTYAFFNYTRTGTANTIRVGRIAFNTSQASGQDGAINLSNAFPITRTLAVTDNTNAGEVVITITGDTSYSGGVEYLVTATDVTNTVNSKTVPISIIATASNGLGSSDDSYFTNRGGNSSIYKVLANETVSNDDQLLVGYIAPDNNQTGVNGTITIRAYLDSDLVVISDTYNNGNTPTDNLGTPASFGEGKTVLTTSEWNSLRTNGVSFKIKVEANEGTWVSASAQPLALPTMAEMCPNCKFLYPSGSENYYYAEYYDDYLDETFQISTYEDIVNRGDILYDDYNEVYVVNSSNKPFLGLIFENGTSGKIIRAFACGVKPEASNGTPFCIEGSLNGATTTSTNEILNTIFGTFNYETGFGCDPDYLPDFYCTGNGNFYSGSHPDGDAWVRTEQSQCSIYYDGSIYCG